MREAGQLAAHPRQVGAVDLGRDHALALARPREHAAPGVDDQRLAPVGEAVRARAGLIGGDQVALVLGGAGATEDLPVGRPGGEREGGGDEQHRLLGARAAPGEHLGQDHEARPAPGSLAYERLGPSQVRRPVRARGHLHRRGEIALHLRFRGHSAPVPRASTQVSIEGCTCARSCDSRKRAMGRLVKRYGNRKLYDTSESRYVTLDEIGRWVKAGEDVKILENDTGEDLTAVTFAQDRKSTRPNSSHRCISYAVL